MTATNDTQEMTILSPRLDIVFKSIFTQESDDGRIARNSMISSLTGLDIKETTVLNNDIPIDREIAQKRIRLDVHCKTGTGEEIDVEIQMAKSDYNIPNRLEYYASRLLSGAEKVSDDYQNIHPVYQIMICDFTLDENEKEPLLTSTVRNHHGRPFGSLLNIITLELTKIKLPKTDISKISDEELETWFENLTAAEKWGTFFKWADDKEKLPRLSRLFDTTVGAENARRILMDLNQSRAERELAEARLKWIMDYTSDKNAAYRKGYAKAEAEAATKILTAQAETQKAQAEVKKVQARIADLEARLAKYEEV